MSRLLRMDERGRVRVDRERRAELLAEFDRSGMSGAAFARWAGIKYPTFAGWLQQRRNGYYGGRRASAPALAASRASAPATASASGVAWAELVVSAPVAAAAGDVGATDDAARLRVRLPGGATLELDGAPATLRLAAALLRELERGADNAGGRAC